MQSGIQRLFSGFPPPAGVSYPPLMGILFRKDGDSRGTGEGRRGDPRRKPLSKPKPKQAFSRIGFALSAAYLGSLLAYAAVNWDAFVALDPNEVGDFLAGSFAPLAFLWLVLGFMQQGEELRYSADALWLQGRELQHSVVQQRELVKVTREQLELEQNIRKAAERDAERRLKIEQDMRKAAERDAERKITPNLKLRELAVESIGGGLRYSFSLINLGAPCVDLRVSWNGAQRYRWNSLKGEELIHIDVFDNHPVEELDVVVCYLDILGRDAEQCFHLRAVERKTGPGFNVRAEKIRRPPQMGGL